MIALQLGGVPLNLPEFTWLIGCAIVNDNYLFLSRKVVFFGYSQAIRAER